MQAKAFWTSAAWLSQTAQLSEALRLQHTVINSAAISMMLLCSTRATD
jgi:hypothetical protein